MIDLSYILVMPTEKTTMGKEIKRNTDTATDSSACSKIYTKRLGSLIASSARPAISGKFHVISGDRQNWSVVADGQTKASRVFATKTKAIEFAKSSAHKLKGAVVVHKKTGEIEQRISLAD